MSMVFKKLQNKILVHMKTFDKPHIRVLDHLLGREKHFSVFFPNSLYVLKDSSKTDLKNLEPSFPAPIRFPCIYKWAVLFLICSLIWNIRVGNSDSKKKWLIVITLVVPLKDIIDISFHWGIQSNCDGKCSGLGIVLN